MFCSWYLDINFLVVSRVTAAQATTVRQPTRFRVRTFRARCSVSGDAPDVVARGVRYGVGSLAHAVCDEVRPLSKRQLLCARLLTAFGPLHAVRLDPFDLFPVLLAACLPGGVSLLFALRPACRLFLLRGGFSRGLPLEDTVGEGLDIEAWHLLGAFLAVLTHQLALGRSAG